MPAFLKGVYMKVVIYYENGKREEIDLVHEILERSDDVALTYTDLSDNTYKSKLVPLYNLARLGVRV